MRRILLLVTAIVMCVTAVFAQTRTITGTVTDESGNGLPDVSVLIKGTSSGTATNSSGEFSINVPANRNVLVFSAVGYAEKELTVTQSGHVSIVLTSKSASMDEVVVVGYGTQTRREFTGSASTIKGGVVADKPIQSFGQGLTGQASGVNIIQPNGLLNNPPVIRVRGLSSISLSSFPLVVIDGIPISTGDVSANSSTNNPLGDINPADIESIDILKDAASASIYGSRAAAGVLVITTKKGKTGRIKVNYDAWAGVSNAVRLPKLLNAEQYVAHKNAAIINAFEVNPNFSAAARNSFVMMKDADSNLVNTNWQDVVYRTAFSQSHNLSFSGGSEKTTYFLSAGYTKQDGFLRANDFSRKSARVNLNNQTTRWLKLFTTVSYSNSINNAANSGSHPGGAFNSSGLGRIAMAQAPNVLVYKADGNYNIEGNAIGRGANLLSMQWVNPQVLIDKDKNRSETNRIFANLGGEVQFFPGLTFRSSYTWDLRLTDNQQFWNPLNGDGNSWNGYAYNNTARADNWNWTNVLQFKKTFNDVHNLDILAGSDAQNTRTTNWGGVRSNLADPFFTQYQGVFLTNDAGGNGIAEIAFEAYLSSLSYNYDNRYFFSANVRRDGNSALSPNNRWGTFGGASIGWSISNESFFESLKEKVSNLRLRASWGRVGNGNLSNYYGSYNLYGTGIYGALPAVVYTQSGNNELKWETSSQTNIGVDAGVLDNRLTFEINWFNKNIDNMILGVPQAPSKGIPGNSILLNVGSMYNRGWEFAINAIPVRKNDFTWTTNINFSTLKNEVTSLVDDNTPILGYTGDLELSTITKVGLAASNIYGVKTAGVNPENGRRIFINTEGKKVQYQHQGGANAWTLVDGGTAVSSGTVTGAAVPLGNTIPTWFGGFNNTFAYKGLDLGLNFTFSGGNYIYNGSRAGLLDQRVWNNSVEVLNAWTPTNKNTNIPRAIYTDNISNGSAFLIDANVEKGDFLRLQTAVLGYRLPAQVFGNSGISSMRFYVQGSNLFLLTGYSGVDPEISTNGNSNIASGIERNTIPQGRVITFGVNVGF